MVFSPTMVTVILAVKNEGQNIPKCLSALSWAYEIFVIDSNSNDNTTNLSKKFGAQVIQFEYNGGYPKKRQWALENLPIKTDWVLMLDADEVVTEELAYEIQNTLGSRNDYDAYLISKQFHFMKKRFRFGGFSHSAIILFKKGRAFYEELIVDDPSSLDIEVHERLIVQGSVGKINAPLRHEDFKGLEAYIDRHNKYSSWESKLRFSYFSSGAYGNLSISPNIFGGAQERRRFLKLIAMRIPFESLAWFIYHYFLRLGFLEGRPGLIASQIRASYISQVRAKIYELEKNARL